MTEEQEFPERIKELFDISHRMCVTFEHFLSGKHIDEILLVYSKVLTSILSSIAAQNSPSHEHAEQMALDLLKQYLEGFKMLIENFESKISE